MAKTKQLVWSASKSRFAASPGKETEGRFLGSVLVSPDDVWVQARVLRERDFCLTAHRVMFGRLRMMAEAGRPLDESTLVEELDRAGELEPNGRFYIASLTDSAVPRTDIRGLVESIRENATRRSAAKTGERLHRASGDRTINPTALAELAAGFVRECDERSASVAAPPNGSIPDGEQTVAQIEQYIRRFAVLPTVAYLALAIWTIATYAAKQFDCFPYVALISPTKRCGKTRLLEILEQLVSGAWRGTAPTPAALFRMMASTPTLLLDEVEVFNAKNKSESGQVILAILNAGHRKGATIPRCEGPQNKLTHFPVYGPKAFAAIGRLPDTLTDRSICITMQRRTAEQQIERFLVARAAADAKAIRESVASFQSACTNDIGQAYARLVKSDLKFLGDRDADLWIPLFAMCSIAAPSRLGELKRCAQKLSAGKTDDDADDSPPIKLLADIREVWPGEQDRCGTAVLIDRLKALEESPWGQDAHALTARRLARMLRPFGVAPRQLPTLNQKGYVRDEFLAAFSRYLPAYGVLSETCETTHINTGESGDSTSETQANISDRKGG